MNDGKLGKPGAHGVGAAAATGGTAIALWSLKTGLVWGATSIAILGVCIAVAGVAVIVETAKDE